MLVRAISDDALAFYRHVSFESSPLEPMATMVALAASERWRKCSDRENALS
jgi:hypothetical protein